MIGLFSAASAAAAQSGDLLYKVVGGTEITITGYAGSGGALTLPEAINGLPVTRIGTNAFEGRTGLTGVVTIPDSVVSIGRQAFAECDNLSGLILGGGVREIQFGAFAECSGLSGALQIPESVTNIDLYAFADCGNLTGNLTIPDNVTTIGAGAFAGCKKLTGLTLGAALVEIGGNAFGRCSGLAGTVVIPDGVSEINPQTFSGCGSLVGIIIGSGVTYIGERPFENCSLLSAICFKGAAPGLYATAFYGTSATLCYVEGQEGWNTATLGGRPTTVWRVTALFDAGLGTASYTVKSYAVGNPFGDLPTAARLLFCLAGWRTATNDYSTLVTVTSQVPYVAGALKLYATWASLFQTVTFDTQGGSAVSPASKNVTYGSAYGSLPTPARTGYTFCGWFLNAEGTGSAITESTLVSTLSSHTLYACWYAKGFEVTFNGENGVASADTLSVRYGSPYGTLPDSCRLGYAFGGWWTAANGTGVRVTATTVVSTANSHTLYAKWTYDAQATQTAPAGVALSLQLPDTFADATGITAKGLPTGLKYNTQTRTVTGVPTKSGNFLVTIAAKSASVTPLNFTFIIVALPTWAYGSFSGEHNRHGLCSMTISAQGKVAGKLSYAGTNFTFGATSFQAAGNPVTGFRLIAVAKSGKNLLSLNLLLKQEDSPAPQTSGCAWGSYADGAQNVWMALWRDVWNDEPALLAPYIGYYTATLSGTNEYGSGYLTLTTDKYGIAKVVGKLADGTAFTTSFHLVLVGDDVYFPVAASPAAYKGGHVYGAILLRKPSGGKVCIDDRIYWESRNPRATENYGEGFKRTLVLTGGWYDKLGNLYDYYKKIGLYAGADASAQTPELAVSGTEHPATCWNPGGVTVSVVTNKAGVMTGLAAPKPGAPTDSDHNNVWDYTSNNVLGLTISLTRSTGIFKGSFKAWFDYGTTHTSKSLTYEGVLTPVRVNTNDGIAGRGFFLWPDKAVPALPAQPYSFFWSYDFLLWCQ